MSVLKLEPAASALAAVARIHGNYHVLATAPIGRGHRVLRLEGDLRSQPTRYTVQVAAGLHLEVPPEAGLELVLDRYFWRFLNHSCDPNATLRGQELMARRRIQPWEEVTFDYDTTEYDMAEPFPCRCGSPSCRGLIRGFRHLDPTQRRRLRARLAPHLRGRADTGAAPGMETPA